jgi:hypothetical protein
VTDVEAFIERVLDERFDVSPSYSRDLRVSLARSSS